MSLYVFSDATRVGKTTSIEVWCRNRMDIGGFLSPLHDGKRIFYFIAKKQFVEMELVSQASKEIWNIGRYSFSKSAFDEATKVLTDDWQEGKQICVLDEYGPLEQEDKGLLPNLNPVILAAGNSVDQHLLVVVRKSILNQFVSRYRVGNIFDMQTIKHFFSMHQNPQAY